MVVDLALMVLHIVWLLVMVLLLQVFLLVCLSFVTTVAAHRLLSHEQLMVLVTPIVNFVFFYIIFMLHMLVIRLFAIIFIAILFKVFIVVTDQDHAAFSLIRRTTITTANMIDIIIHHHRNCGTH